MTMPEVVDYDLPFAGAFHNLAIVSIRKAFPGHAQKVMHAIWGTGLLSLTKGVVVVDEWVDVHDYTQVMWQVGANVDPERDVMLSRGPLDHLDHAPTHQFVGGKIGIDATAKGPAEGYDRGWPEVIQMSSEMQKRVTERAAEFGIPVTSTHRPWAGVVWPRCTDWRTTWRIPPPVRKHTPTPPRKPPLQPPREASS